MSIAERIVSERKRLGLSQADFAIRLGVSLSTQKRYEKGVRSPDVSYLDSLLRIGVDVLFVLASTAPEWHKESIKESVDSLKEGDNTGWLFLFVLGIPKDEWARIVDRVIKRDYYGAPLVDGNDPAWGKEIARASCLISGLIESASTLESSLLAGILEGFDSALSVSGKTIEQSKKAQAVALLYRAFKASGKVDQAMIEEAVKLAAS